MAAPVRVFTAQGCIGCEAVEHALAEGTLQLIGVPEGTIVEVIDVTSEEGFSLVEKYRLESVPSAFFEVNPCAILMDEESGQVIIDCDAENLDAPSIPPA